MVKNKGAIANELKPFEPTHPGEVLKDEIDCRGISQRQLAHEIGVSSSLLNEVLNGERALNTQLALLLSAALDIDAEPLLRLQAKYDMLTGHKTPSFIQRLNIYWRKRSIPTHSEWLYPLTFDAGKGLKEA